LENVFKQKIVGRKMSSNKKSPGEKCVYIKKSPSEKCLQTKNRCANIFRKQKKKRKKVPRRSSGEQAPVPRLHEHHLLAALGQRFGGRRLRIVLRLVAGVLHAKLQKIK
jgi:hypothetical protein